MRSVALSDLNRRPGEIVDMALAGPVTLTKHGRRAVVLMSAEAYDSMVAGQPAQHASVSAKSDSKKVGSSFLSRKAREILKDEHEDEGE